VWWQELSPVTNCHQEETPDGTSKVCSGYEVIVFDYEGKAKQSEKDKRRLPYKQG